MPATARTDPATQRVLASARRILGRPKLAMYLVDTQFPDPANAPHVLRLLQAVVDVAIRAPDEPNMGALLEQFRDTEFAGDVSRLLTHSDAEVDAAVSDEEAETDLRQLRTQIESGSLFRSAQAITMPEAINGVGILALGNRRIVLPELEPLPPAGEGAGERGIAAIQHTSLITPPPPSPPPLSPQGRGEGVGQRLRDFARELRVNQSPWEQELWQALRAHRFADVKFKRQQPLGPYIVDFVALSKSLVIELDGSQHAQTAGYDAKRDAFLKQEGFRVLRVWNNQWTENREGVLEAIWALLTNDHPLPNPSPLKGEGLYQPISDDLDDIPFDFEANFAPSSTDSHDAPF